MVRKQILTAGLVLAFLFCTATVGAIQIMIDDEYNPGDRLTIITTGVDNDVTFQVKDPDNETICLETGRNLGTGVVINLTLGSRLGAFKVYAVETGTGDSANATFVVVEKVEPVYPIDPEVDDEIDTAPIVFALVAAIVIAGASATAWTVESSRMSLLCAALPLYTRLRRTDILDHEVRGAIYGIIIAEPGVHYSKIREKLNLKNGTLAYHLHTLEREGRVKSQRDGVYRRFYPKGASISPKRPAPSRIQQMILSQLEESPGLTQRQLVQRTSLSQQRVSYNLRRLVELELINEVEGRVKRYMIASMPPAFSCTTCGNQFTSDFIPKLCPNCGADMGTDT